MARTFLLSPAEGLRARTCANGTLRSSAYYLCCGIIPRAAIARRYHWGRIMSARPVRYIVIHCSATKPSMDVGAGDIDKWHRARGWRMIGYHLVIRRDGSTETGRPLSSDHLLESEEVGAHVEGYNAVSIGICMVGGVSEGDVSVPENNFTRDQWQTLRRVVDIYQKQFPDAKVVGHRDLNKNKACPSFDVAAWQRGLL